MEESEGEDERIIEGVQIRKIVLEIDIWKIVTAYNKKGEIMKDIKNLILEDKEQNFLIEREFNARLGQEETIIWGDDRDEIGRRSKDRIIEGKRLLEEI